MHLSPVTTASPHAQQERAIRSLAVPRPTPPLRCCCSSSSPPIPDSSSSSPSSSITDLLKRQYKWGFVSDVESFSIPKGLSEGTVRLISEIRQEPPWLLDFRLRAYRKLHGLHIPSWSDIQHPPINLRDISYYSQPRRQQPQKQKKESLDEVQPSILLAYQMLGIPLSEQQRCSQGGIAIDAIFDSTSIAVTHHEELLQQGVIFCSISNAVRDYPDLVQKFLGKVVPPADNFYAALNSAVFSDGSFVYIPKGKRLEMPLSTYFRINAVETGQFERTLIVADEGSSVSYLEGCTAPAYDKNQLHAAVVELFCAEGAEINYSTVQNWYAGDEQGRGGIYNFVTKRGLCAGHGSKISWTQVETGSAITWKYPSVVLKGDKSVGEFYSVALTNNRQQADTGTKMIHIGKDTRSRIVSKGISAGESSNTYRGLVQVHSTSQNAKNYSQCDSLLIGERGGANTYPYIQVKEPTALVEHEASTSKISADQLFYFQQRGVNKEKAVTSIIGGFCGEVFDKLPHEFKQEVNYLMNFKMEGSVG